ncbi:MAG: hypothetical protein DRJ37_03390 [Thermoprotei archaeon]|nr:MAG: hypothetical protein DRJ37_03390 [Thermoprotei archaeon]
MNKPASVIDAIYSIVRPVIPLLATVSYLMGYYWRQIIDLLYMQFYNLRVIPPLRIDVIASIFLAGAYSNMLNSYKDSIDTDRINNIVKDYVNPVLKYNLTKEMVWSIAALSSILSILIVALTAPLVIPFIILGLLISTAYSYYPRLKSYAPFDVIANTLGLFLVPFMMGWTSHSKIENLPVPTIAGFSLMASSFFTLTAIVDYESDYKNDITTIAVKLGLKNSAILCGVLHFAGIILSMDFLRNHLHSLVYLLVDLLLYLDLIKNPTPIKALEIIKKIVIVSVLYVIIMAIYFAWIAKLMSG